MRAGGLLLAIVSTCIAACGFSSDDGDESVATPLAAITTTTSATTTTAPRSGLSYEAQLLDGGTITIEEGVGELSEFTEGRPSAIYALDLLAAIPDCEQIETSLWDWATKAGPTDAGLKASAYAKHGHNLYIFVGCDPDAQAQTIEAAANLDPRFDTCEEAIDAGYVDYRRGEDPEYEWYDDVDGDGVVCEGGFGD